MRGFAVVIESATSDNENRKVANGCVKKKKGRRELALLVFFLEQNNKAFHIHPRKTIKSVRY